MLTPSPRRRRFTRRERRMGGGHRATKSWRALLSYEYARKMDAWVLDGRRRLVVAGNSFEALSIGHAVGFGLAMARMVGVTLSDEAYGLPGPSAGTVSSVDTLNASFTIADAAP